MDDHGSPHTHTHACTHATHTCTHALPPPVPPPQVMALLMRRGLLLDSITAQYSWEWEWGYEPAQVDWSLLNKSSGSGNSPSSPRQHFRARCSERSATVDRKRHVRNGNFTDVYGHKGSRCVLMR